MKYWYRSPWVNWISSTAVRGSYPTDSMMELVTCRRSTSGHLPYGAGRAPSSITDTWPQSSLAALSMRLSRSCAIRDRLTSDDAGRAPTIDHHVVGRAAP